MKRSISGDTVSFFLQQRLNLAVGFLGLNVLVRGMTLEVMPLEFLFRENVLASKHLAIQRKEKIGYCALPVAV